MSDEIGATPQPVTPAAPDKASGMAIAALVLGILALPCCCSCFAGIPALVVAFVENRKINSGMSSEKGKWMVIVAMVLGVISLLFLCGQVIWIAFFGGMNVLQGLTSTLH